MARKSSNIGILRFDEHAISWLRVARTSEGVRVLAQAVARGPWSISDGSMADALRRFVTEHNVADDAVHTVLPRHEMTARILHLPSNDPEEIAGMVRLSSGEFVPYPPEELAIDQCILEELPSGESRVLAVLAHRDIVDAHIQLAHEAGLDPERVYFSSACLASAAQAARSDEPGRIALVDLASGGIEALVIGPKGLEYGRGIAVAQDWSLETGQADEIVEELITEIQTSLAAYRRESETGEEPDALYLCSDWADVGKAAEQIGEEAQPAPFTLDLIEGGAKHLSTLPLVSLGAALTAQNRASVVINLLPERVARRRARATMRRKAIAWSVLFMALLGALGGRYSQAVQQRQELIAELNSRIEEMEGGAQGVVIKEEQLRILQQQVEHEGTALELLATLCAQAPAEGLNLSRIEFRHKEKLNLFGRAKKVDDVSLLTERLRKLATGAYPQFANARRLYELSTAERNKEVFTFSISMEFPQEEDGAEESP